MKGVLLINLGTPNSPAVKDVRKYLTQFLNDKYVIDINPITRFFLVNGIIVPFRASKSAKLYKQIWTKEGSPLLFHGEKVKALLQKELGDNFLVELGMRYQTPSIESAFQKLVDANVVDIVVIPMYPQYAYSSTESTIVEVERIAKKFRFPSIKIVKTFFNRNGFINAWSDATKHIKMEDYDFFLFSYHGLPERQIKRVYPNYCGINDSCCSMITEKNNLCYRAACYETTRQLVKKLNIPTGKYASSFQSRLNDKWLKPYSDKVVEEKATEGIKKMLVFSPSFIADCLETTYEIGVEYNELFKKFGGTEITLVESLNENPVWVSFLKELATT